MANPSSIVIKEQTGDRHKLELIGRALPYQKVKFEGTMNAEVTWYPGNPTATVQMLGPQEGTTAINGIWKDRFVRTTIPGLLFNTPVINPPGKILYDNTAVQDVLQATKIVDGFRRRGQILKFSWDEITRYGIMTRFTQTWDRREDCEWEMEFQWVSQTEAVPTVSFSLAALIGDLINAILDAINSALDFVAACIGMIQQIIDFVNSIVNLINNIVDAIVEIASKLASLGRSIANLAMVPMEIAQAVVSACQSIKSQFVQMANAFESIPDRYGAAIASVTGGETKAQKDDAAATAALVAAKRNTAVENPSQAQVLTISKLKRAAMRAARKARIAAAQKAAELLESMAQRNDVITVIAREGQNLREISQTYYGTPDEWQTIGRFNGIHGSALTVGQIVYVPSLNLAAYGVARG